MQVLYAFSKSPYLPGGIADGVLNVIQLQDLDYLFQQRGPQDELRRSADRLVHLQHALDFRTVTVPSDEVICIANLLQLDISYVLQATDSRAGIAQARMANVGGLIAPSNNGGLPASMVLLADDTLD